MRIWETLGSNLGQNIFFSRQWAKQSGTAVILLKWGICVHTHMEIPSSNVGQGTS
jgi:hypothetical protein